MLNRTQAAITKSIIHARKHFEIEISPSISNVDNLREVALLTERSVKDTHIIFAKDFKIPFIQGFFFFNFQYQNEIGYEATEDFVFNNWVKIKKGDFVAIALNENRYVSDLHLLVNGKEVGISSSIINLEGGKYTASSLAKEDIIPHLLDIEKNI